MSKTSIQIWASIEAEMDDDSATVLGVDLCQLVNQHLDDQGVPVGVVTAFAHHE